MDKSSYGYFASLEKEWIDLHLKSCKGTLCEFHYGSTLK